MALAKTVIQIIYVMLFENAMWKKFNSHSSISDFNVHSGYESSLDQPFKKT